MECWNTGMLGMGHPDSLIIPPFHDSTIPVFPFRPMADSCGRSLLDGFAFLIPAPPLVPGFFWFGARVILLDFCKMDIGPIFFKEILFFDFLEEST